MDRVLAVRKEELVTAGVELTKGFCLDLLKACESSREMHRAEALLDTWPSGSDLGPTSRTWRF